MNIEINEVDKLREDLVNVRQKSIQSGINGRDKWKYKR